MMNNILFSDIVSTEAEFMKVRVICLVANGVKFAVIIF